MAKLRYWALSAIAWTGAAGLAYIGLVFLVLGPMMGPRGDIDYVGFSAAEKHAANVEAFWTSAFGLVPLTMAALIVWGRGRVLRWLSPMPAIPAMGGSAADAHGWPQPADRP